MDSVEKFSSILWCSWTISCSGLLQYRRWPAGPEACGRYQPSLGSITADPSVGPLFGWNIGFPSILASPSTARAPVVVCSGYPLPSPIRILIQDALADAQQQRPKRRTRCERCKRRATSTICPGRSGRSSDRGLSTRLFELSPAAWGDRFETKVRLESIFSSIFILSRIPPSLQHHQPGACDWQAEITLVTSTSVKRSL